MSDSSYVVNYHVPTARTADTFSAHLLKSPSSVNNNNFNMAVLSLPLSFSNSFWSQDYRRGLETLFAKLEQVLSATSFHCFGL
jgi:hypothetical protein